MKIYKYNYDYFIQEDDEWFLVNEHIKNNIIIFSRGTLWLDNIKIKDNEIIENLYRAKVLYAPTIKFDFGKTLLYYIFYSYNKYDFNYFLDNIQNFNYLEKVEIYKDDKLI